MAEADSIVQVDITTREWYELQAEKGGGMMNEHRMVYGRILTFVALHVFFLIILLAAYNVYADEKPQSAPQGTASAISTKSTHTTAFEKDTESPWIIAPLLSVNPKLGTSLGLMVGYMHYFDEKSQVSTFGLSAQYTSSSSEIAALAANASFGEDHHRILALLAGGLIKNDYNDYLGTGMPLKTEDNLYAFATRYLYRVYGNWFVGPQAVFTNYEIVGDSWLDTQTLDILGVTGFRAGGLGVSVYYDSKDRTFSPNRGFVMNFNNIAYRDWLGGKDNFNVYRLDLRYFWGHGDGHVLALHQFNQWTFDAPMGAEAPITLRGYKMGQYLGNFMSAIEVEERLHIWKRLGATAFAGVGCLYGHGESCSDHHNVYPDAGVGIQYILKPKEGLVANLEYAQGKGDNYGVIMKLNYSY